MIGNLELRESNRRPIQARTEVRLHNGVVVEGEAVDISYRGLMFLTERRLPIGKPVRVILIPQSDVAPPRINAGGFIARLHDEGVAVRFTEIDSEGMRYLRDQILNERAPISVVTRNPHQRAIAWHV